MTNEQRRMNNDPGAAGGREDHTAAPIKAWHAPKDLLQS